MPTSRTGTTGHAHAEDETEASQSSTHEASLKMGLRPKTAKLLEEDEELHQVDLSVVLDVTPGTGNGRKSTQTALHEKFLSSVPKRLSRKKGNARNRREHLQVTHLTVDSSRTYRKLLKLNHNEIRKTRIEKKSKELDIVPPKK